ncbi:putative Calcium/calmodulin-dependent protein kinase [Candidatus Promineifilum breve]|uniref:non-specific serine/threonine protein kinase n=1 Tax=Candidatus Promineifilum breve TaxID=1806508 RepID=A0A160T720_9CHLR|nr:serine/threonine protein kinase [Candidatus Promineifilum breve]CUS05098.2 putative Calcium/calmodulin-dependent protein kinase [Candidatus Promineifilum breve]
MAVASLFEDLLDQYKIEQLIAAKRYTDLFQAYDVDDDRLVRLDVVHAGLAEDSAFAGQFISRARALAQVRHSNIAPILHVGKTTGGAPYVTQAAIDGSPLSHRLEQLAQRTTPVNSIYALKLIRQLADALLLAERLEIFHYDLQPDNVLLKNVTRPTDDSVVLIDLFIPAERPTRTAAPEDTPNAAYLSPEQRAGRAVTAPSHVYSLGAMLYRLLAGHLPGGSVSMGDTVINRTFGRATALERDRGDLSPATYALIDRALRKDPRGRFPTIEAFVVALDDALAAEEVRLGSAAGNRAPADARPRPWIFALLVLALLLAVGAVAARNLVDRAPTAGPAATPTAGQTLVAVVASLTPAATDEPTAIPATTNADEAAPAVQDTTVPEPTVASPSPTPTPTPTAPPTSALPTATLEQPLVRVIFNLVNLRRGPGVGFATMGSVAGGELLEVVARNDDEADLWYLVVTADQRVGWIAEEVVQVTSVEALQDVPVAATIPPAPIILPTATVTPTPTVIAPFTVVPTIDPDDDNGGGEGGGTSEPPPPPTAEPTDIPGEPPTLTPPPLPTVES